MIGYAFCGSFCTLEKSITAMRALVELGEQILPIMSGAVYDTDTRFFAAEDFRRAVTDICGREIIHTVKDTEPLGPKTPLDALVVAPCTGNTLAKVASGITDTPVTMAIKAHLRCDRPTLFALASNDAMSQNLGNIGKLLNRKSVYFVPMLQDDAVKKPHSLVSDFSLVPEAFLKMKAGAQLRPLFLS